MSTLAQLAELARDQSHARSEAKLAAYAAVRPWSRTDSARWLSARSEAVLARLRRLGRECPAFSSQMGAWLKEVARDRSTFDRAHEALRSLPNDAAREAAIVLEILR